MCEVDGFCCKLIFFSPVVVVGVGVCSTGSSFTRKKVPHNYLHVLRLKLEPFPTEMSFFTIMESYCDTSITRPCN